MASYTKVGSTHQTLTANTVDTVTLDKDYNAVEVLNRDASADIFFTTDGVTDPVVLADGTFIVRAGQALIVNPATGGLTIIKLISAGAAAYTVQGI